VTGISYPKRDYVIASTESIDALQTKYNIYGTCWKQNNKFDIVYYLILFVWKFSIICWCLYLIISVCNSNQKRIIKFKSLSGIVIITIMILICCFSLLPFVLVLPIKTNNNITNRYIVLSIAMLFI